MKGYPLVFDQIMADFCALLERFGDLFSIDPALEKTYFYQAVDTLREFEAIYDVVLDPQLPRPAARVAASQQAADLVRTYADEPAEARRRSPPPVSRSPDRALRRAIPRVTPMRFRRRSGPSSRTLRRHKCRFLKAYPTMAGDRGGAYDHTATPASLWNSSEVSGLERRLLSPARHG